MEASPPQLSSLKVQTLIPITYFSAKTGNAFPSDLKQDAVTSILGKGSARLTEKTRKLGFHKRFIVLSLLVDHFLSILGQEAVFLYLSYLQWR